MGSNLYSCSVPVSSFAVAFVAHCQLGRLIFLWFRLTCTGFVSLRFSPLALVWLGWVNCILDSSSSIVIAVSKIPIPLTCPVWEGISLLHYSMVRGSAAEVVIGDWLRYLYCPAVSVRSALGTSRSWSSLYCHYNSSVCFPASWYFGATPCTNRAHGARGDAIAVTSVCQAVRISEVVSPGAGRNKTKLHGFIFVYL